MFDKKFNVIRISIICVTVLALAGIFLYESSLNKEEDTKITKDTVIDKAKDYVEDNKDYYNEIIYDKELEFRINTKELVNKKYLENDDNFNGYIKIAKDNYEFVESGDYIIEKLFKDDNIFEEANNEGMPFDMNYVYRNNPNNYIMYKNNKYRIVGTTNLSMLKLISIESEEIKKWGSTGTINYLEGKIEEDKIGTKGIFYVGFVRSETDDLALIIKNEKRNNNYTKVIPKYYGYSSYSTISDVINASTECKFTKITDINKEKCNSYLIDMLKNTYLSTTGENNTVYYINEKGEVELKPLTENIKVNKVIYVNGITKYIGGDGSIDNPYVIEE